MKTVVTAIIHLPQMKSHASDRCGKFLRSKAHDNLHVWEGRELTIEEFNKAFPEAVRLMKHMQYDILAKVFVREVGVDLAAPEKPEAQKVPIKPEETLPGEPVAEAPPGGWPSPALPTRTEGEDKPADGPDTTQKVDETGAPSFGLVAPESTGETSVPPPVAVNPAKPETHAEKRKREKAEKAAAKAAAAAKTTEAPK